MSKEKQQLINVVQVMLCDCHLLSFQRSPVESAITLATSAKTRVMS